MKRYCILLLLIFVPFTIQAKENTVFEVYPGNSIWVEKFPEKFDREYEVEKPSASSVAKEILKVIRNHNSKIDKLAYWLGKKVGTFIPVGNFTLRNNGELDHQKTSVNIFDGDPLDQGIEGAKKNHHLFTYKLQPKINFGGKLGIKLSLQKKIWNMKFSLINEYKKDRDNPDYYLFSMLKMSYCF